MALAISLSPHTKKPGDLMDQLLQMERKNEGLDYLDSEFDAVGFERLKQKIAGAGGSIIVK